LKILFYIAKFYAIPVIKPLVSFLENTDNAFSFFVSRKVSDQIPDAWRRYPVFQTVRAARGFKPEFVLCPGNFVDYRIPGKKVQIFHGLGIEKPSHFQVRHFFDIYCASGPFVTRRFKDLQKKHRSFLVKETGWPKIDDILNFPQKGLKDKYNIPSDKKVILYAPTHSSKMQSADQLLSVFPGCVGEDEIWFIKFHEFMNKEARQTFQALAGSNIRIADHYDGIPYLHLADVLISDTSSMVYEMMVLNKPVITFRTMGRKDKGIDIQEAGELRAALDRSLANPGEFQKQRAAHLKEVNPYLDGKISQRIFQTLEEIERSGETPEKRKPLNLFRKSQVLYHSLFRKGYLR